MPKHGLTAWLCATVLLCGLPAAHAAQGSGESRGVLLVLVASLTLRDARELPALRRAMDGGCSALMNSRVGRALPAPFGSVELDALTSGYLTLACGSRAAAGSEASRILERTESGGGLAPEQLWGGYRGERASNAEAFAPWFEVTRKQAGAAPYDIEPGALGDLVAEHDIPSIVIGNADFADEKHREAALLVMRSSGEVPNARIGSQFVLRDARFPYGARTNTAAVIREMGKDMRAYRFVVVETGDPHRYARYEANVLEEARPAMRRMCLRTADDIVAACLTMLPKGWKLVIASPGQVFDTESPGASMLAPLIVFERGCEAGLLVSGSTRRGGVVANTDVAASLAAWLGVSAKLGGGQVIHAEPSRRPTQALERIHAEAGFQAGSRGVVYLFVYFSAAFFLLAALLTFAQPPPLRWLQALTAAPPAAAAALLAGWVWMPDVRVLAAACLAAALAAALLRMLCRRCAVDSILAITAAIGVPAACLAGVLARTPASYEIAGGARYYGLGNEYGGVFVGAVCYLAASPRLLRSRTGQAAGIGLLAAAAVFAGAPGLGANAGVMLGTLAACAAFLLAVSRRPIGFAVPALLGIVLIACVVAFADSLRPQEEQSHFGRAFGAIRTGGLGVVAEIAGRKAALNAVLLRNSPWALLMGGAVLAAAAGRRLAGRSDRRGRVRFYVLCTAVGALLAMNDSGVLAGAACAIWLVLAVFQEIEGPGGNPGPQYSRQKN